MLYIKLNIQTEVKLISEMSITPGPYPLENHYFSFVCRFGLLQIRSRIRIAVIIAVRTSLAWYALWETVHVWMCLTDKYDDSEKVNYIATPFSDK